MLAIGADGHVKGVSCLNSGQQRVGGGIDNLPFGVTASPPLIPLNSVSVDETVWVVVSIATRSVALVT